MDYAVILAGGKGSRFWPLSREVEPKQFLNVCSIKPMIEESVSRISRIIGKENIYIATGKIYSRKIKKCAKRLNIAPGNILFEPESKNTFAPIAVLSKFIDSLDPEACLVILPSDHFIRREERFLKLLSTAMGIARDGYIVSLGVPPKRPETGYGYIKAKSRKDNFYLIDRFIEKPGLARAKEFIKDRKYYWNSGIFIFRPAVLLQEIKRLMPGIHKVLMRINNKRDLVRMWNRLPSVSIDYAIMEKTRSMALLPADCGWMDLGSWEAVAGIVKKDKNGNVFRGKHIDIGSRDTLAWADKRLIATLGLENIIIVDTPDALLVCRRDMSQNVKKIIELLRRKNYKRQI